VYLHDNNIEIKSTDCECPRGAFKCSHAATLYIHGIYNLSRTDIPCTWKKAKPQDTKTKSVAEMFPPIKPNYVALSRKPSSNDRENLYDMLKRYGKFTGLCWLISPEPQMPLETLPIPTIEDIIYSEEFLKAVGAEAQRKIIVDKAKVNDEVIARVNAVTVGQRNNPLWHLARKGRLTASNFGCILNAKRVTPSLIKILHGEYDISRVKAVAWGTTNESEAVKAFTSITGLPVVETGLWLHESGVLGASPDGLIGANHILEVKCPFTARNMTIDEAVTNIKSFCLEKSEKGPLQLKKGHVYWHQVQGQMAMAKRYFCYFVVWTTKQTCVFTIQKDAQWQTNIELLKDFYFVHIFPKVTEGEL